MWEYCFKMLKKCPQERCSWGAMEAPPRLELGVELLQSSALPLGYGADRMILCPFGTKKNIVFWKNGAK